MRRIIGAVLLAWITATGTFCQTLPETPADTIARKKVAVVMSGGGAKGMAHIGALKVIERAGIPIDIVTGTSMGSIVGGLYAIGYNADLLDSLVRKQNWSFILSDKEDLSMQNLKEREKQNTYLLTRAFLKGKKDVADGGFIKGKNLADLFLNLTTGYNDSIDFNTLPIPFACVATDILDNTEYDFHSGILSQAMRASMAIPGAFSPVRIGNKVLVDGGLRNNYPADLAREMGADIIIGITVQGAPRTAEDLGSTMSVIGQIVDVNCKNKYDDNLAITDLPIRVNTTGYGPASFTLAAIDTLIRRGEEEAMRHWDELMALKQRIGVDDTFQPKRLTPLQPTVMTDRVKIASLEFQGMTPNDIAFIRQKFHLHEGDSIDRHRAELVTTSMRVDLFYKDAVSRFYQQDGGSRVVFIAGPKKSVQLSAGIRVDSEELVALQVNGDIPLQTSFPTDLDVTVRLGKRIMARAEFSFTPRTYSKKTVIYTFRHNNFNVYNKGKKDYDFTYNQHTAELQLFNYNFRNLSITAGARWDYLNYDDVLIGHDVEIEGDVPDNEHFFSYLARVNYNSEDNWYFPTRGARFQAQYSYITDNFAQLDGYAGLSDVSASWRMSFPLSSMFSIQPMAYGRLLFGKVQPSIWSNTIGGEWFGHYIEQQMPFAGVGHIEHVDAHFIALQLQAQARLTTNNYVQLRFAAAQNAPQLGDILKHRTMLGGAVSYNYNTLFGPVGASLGYSNYTKKVYFFVNAGFVF